MTTDGLFATLFVMGLVLLGIVMAYNHFHKKVKHH